MSHDLRSPLRSIDGFSQALQEEYEDGLDDTARNYLSRIRKAAQRMGQLIDDLLNLSRIARAEPKFEHVDLGPMVEEIVETLRVAEPERQVELRVGDRLNVRGDPQLLRIALENLLGNAWKFTAGRTPARIEVKSVIIDREISYCIRDNGAGFDMAYSKQLFAAFQRLHDARIFPGTGIGLATVQRIIHHHGGRVWAEGAVDQGAAFYFTLRTGETSG